MAKSDAPAEVVEDSDEAAKASKKKTPEAENEGGNEGSDANDEEEEEYEIEAILDAKHGAFPGGRMGFLVKWKGYGDDHNSWVDQADAGNAQDLIDEFWEKRKKQKKNKPKDAPKGRPRKSGTTEVSATPDEDRPTNKRKKSVSKSTKSNVIPSDEDGEGEEDEEEKPVKKPKKTPRAKEKNDVMDVDEEPADIEYKPMEKYRSQKSWENLVARVDTIEKMDGVLKVFFTLNNGDKVVESSQECAKHFPQKLIQFYESNLRWRETE